VKTETVLEHLQRNPAAFSFDAALRVLMRHAGTADPAEAARFVSRPGLAFAAADVESVDPTAKPPVVTVGLLGLAGSAGVLPRRYTEHAAEADGKALHAMLDMLAQRMLADLGRAGTKYRLDRALEAARLAGENARAAHVEALLAFAGFAGDTVTGRLPFGTDSLLHYAGLFALRPRSAERLAALTADWLGRPVEVVEFVGAWLPIEPDQRTRLGVGRDPGAFTVLGGDAAPGIRAWDQQARVMLRVGPLDRPGFEALLPDGVALKALIGLIRAYLGFEVGFAVNLVLAAAEIPRLRLAARQLPGARLGWNTWLDRGTGFVAHGDADDARFAAEMVEG
jgi:type VI secretion system protein ImpH